MSTVLAKDLNHEHINNLVTVEHEVRVIADGVISIAETTGQVISITKVHDQSIHVVIGGHTIILEEDDELIVHATQVSMISPELIDLVNSITSAGDQSEGS